LVVRAAGVNPIDYPADSGAFGTNPAALPIRLGAEAAGVVTAVSAGVSDVAVGDEVIAYRASGAYAAEVVVPVEAVTPSPVTMLWEEAGGLLVTGATAFHTLEAVGGHKLAVARGSAVIGAARPANHDPLRDFGAIPVAYG